MCNTAASESSVSSNSVFQTKRGGKKSLEENISLSPDTMLVYSLLSGELSSRSCIAFTLVCVSYQQMHATSAFPICELQAYQVNKKKKSCLFGCYNVHSHFRDARLQTNSRVGFTVTVRVSGCFLSC